MRIDLTATDAWIALSDQYRHALGFQDPALNVQVYFGYQHALLEITQSIARLFSHKKTIAIVGPVEPAFEPVLVSFAEDGYVIKSVRVDEAADPAWVTSMQSELLFALCSEDDPVTGRLYDHPKLSAAFKDKRIFLISVSHARHRMQAMQKPETFEARILSLRPDRALMVAGGRCRISPPVASTLPWRLEDPAKVKDELKVTSEADIAHARTTVEDFESDLPDDFESYFKKGEPRTYDRTVIFHPGFDGSAIAHDIAKSLNIKLAAPGDETQLDSTSPCRWVNPRIAQWLLSRGESEEKIRGLLVASSDLIRNGLEEKLIEASDRIRALQEGH